MSKVNVGTRGHIDWGNPNAMRLSADTKKFISDRLIKEPKMTPNPMTDRELEALIEDVEAASEEAYGAPLAEHSDPYFYDFCQLIVRKQLARIRSKLPWPKVFGTGRVADNPKELSVNFHAVPTDDELRAFDEAVKGHGAALSTEAQPEVTGAVAWRFMVNRCHEVYSSVLPPEDAYDEGSLVPLYPPSAIQAAVREKLEEVLQMCIAKKEHAEKTYGVAEAVGADMCIRGVRALMETKS